MITSEVSKLGSGGGGTGSGIGTIAGAAIGTAVAPGVGTVIGGALGGMLGGSLDSKGGGGGSTVIPPGIANTTPSSGGGSILSKNQSPSPNDASQIAMSGMRGLTPSPGSQTAPPYTPPPNNVSPPSTPSAQQNPWQQAYQNNPYMMLGQMIGNSFGGGGTATAAADTGAMGAGFG